LPTSGPEERSPSCIVSVFHSFPARRHRHASNRLEAEQGFRLSSLKRFCSHQKLVLVFNQPIEGKEKARRTCLPSDEMKK
jgi:hypothetical protein